MLSFLFVLRNVETCLYRLSFSVAGYTTLPLRFLWQGDTLSTLPPENSKNSSVLSVSLLFEVKQNCHIPVKISKPQFLNDYPVVSVTVVKCPFHRL